MAIVSCPSQVAVSEISAPTKRTQHLWNGPHVLVFASTWVLISQPASSLQDRPHHQFQLMQYRPLSALARSSPRIRQLLQLRLGVVYGYVFSDRDPDGRTKRVMVSPRVERRCN